MSPEFTWAKDKQIVTIWGQYRSVSYMGRNKIICFEDLQNSLDDYFPCETK